MLPELAPKHVARITELANNGFYDGIIFHRVIPDFMAQTGDPDGTGMGGSGQSWKPSSPITNIRRVLLAWPGHEPEFR